MHYLKQVPLLLAALTTGTVVSAQLLLQPSPWQLEAPLILEADFDSGIAIPNDNSFSSIQVVIDNGYAAFGEIPLGGEPGLMSSSSSEPGFQWEFYSTGLTIETGRSFGNVAELAGGFIGDFPDMVLDFTVSTNWVSGAVIDLWFLPAPIFDEPFVFLGRAGGSVYAFQFSVDGFQLQPELQGEGDFTLYEQNGDGFEGGEFGATFTMTEVFIVAPVPEPSLIALLAVGGLGGLIWFRRRAKR